MCVLKKKYFTAGLTVTCNCKNSPISCSDDPGGGGARLKFNHPFPPDSSSVHNELNHYFFNLNERGFFSNNFASSESDAALKKVD